MGNENNNKNKNNNEVPPQINPPNNNNNNINENNKNGENKDIPLEESGFNLLNNSNNNNSISENNNNVINEVNNHENENNNGDAPGLPNQDHSQPAPVGTETQKDDSDCPVPTNLKEYEKNFSFDSLISKIKDTAKKAGLKAIYIALLFYFVLEFPTIALTDIAIIYIEL